MMSPCYSSLKVNNRFFSHASCLWNELPKELRQPVGDESVTVISSFSHLFITITIITTTNFTLHHSIFLLYRRKME